ncbi:MAG: S41 family peptidase [Gemmatimonadales bacterium]
MTTRSTTTARYRWGMVLVIGVLSFASGGWLLHGTADQPEVDANQLFEQVLGAVKTYYVDSLPNDSLFHKATAGMLEQLGDPYSTLLEDDDFRALTEQTTGNYGGLGIQIDVRDGWITVVAPLPETPAERAGMEAGDQIVSVDGKSTQGLNQDDAIKTLRGAPGTSVTVQVRRPGLSQLMTFRITRETIHNRSVQPGVLVTPTIGLVQLTPVSETSADELSAEINRMRKAGMRGLILDLRRNPGGLLDQGVAVSDLFLDKGQQIVSTRGRAEGTSMSYAASRDQAWEEMPVVVLVDQWTASAAEIISGALQDNDRAVVVGVPTFGKGLVQSLFRLGPTRALKLTTARWFTPSGRTIQRDAANEEAQVRAVTAIANGEDSGALDSLPSHRTVGGRTVRGGGGIVPDRIVRGDTLTDGERAFARALAANIESYQDALVVTALELKERRSVTAEQFTVDAAMRQAVYDKLEAKGVTLTEDERAGGAELLDDQLGYQVARYVFGRQAEIRRRALDDKQVQEAVRLLQVGTTPRALMSEITGQ